MKIKVRYDIPIGDFDYIPEGTELEIDTSWSEYEGFVVAKYREGYIYFNVLYLEEMPALVECV